MILNEWIDSYEKHLNKKETIQQVKKHLSYLSNYYYLLNRGENQSVVQEETTDIMDYMTYSSSVIEVSYDDTRKYQENQIIKAMQKQADNNHKKALLMRQRIAYCKWILQAIQKLPDQEKNIIVQRYIEKKSMEHICQSFEYLSMSSLYRLMNTAYLKLACILDLEVYRI